MSTTAASGAKSQPQIDKAALRAKYRPSATSGCARTATPSICELKGHLAHYLDDPYTPVEPREAKTDHVTFAFVGGGFAGLVTGARLVEAGIADVRIIEKGGDFGGTWYWNRYPGAQCDTASMVYMPLLEETGHRPTEKYAHAPEILAHCQRIGRHYDLYDNALFHTEVKTLELGRGASRWVIETNRGDDSPRSFVGLGTGPLHVPKLPGIPGIETFKGHSFHTSRWDYGYTGGDPAGGPLDKLADKRVAIIGTGATAVQCVPHLARACKRTLRLPAHALLGRRARQRADRSGLVRRRSPRPAGSSAGWRTSPPTRPAAGRGGPGPGRLDRPVAPDPRQDHAAAARELTPQNAGGLRGLRLREDGGDPRPGGRASSRIARPRRS